MSYINEARTKVKTYAARYAVSQMVRMLAASSDSGLIRLTRLIECLAITDIQRQYIHETRKILEQGHPVVKMIRHFLSRDVHPNYRRNLATNLFANATLLGYGTRKEICRRKGFTPPFFMVISPTMRCNLSCYGCYAGQYKKVDELDYDTVSRIISEAKEMGIYFITISGGEPFSYERLLDLFEEHHDVFFQIYTNGTLIDERTTERLVSLGNALPAISVEGYEAETDARRGKGIYKKVCDTMSRLRDARAMFGFSATVTRHNVDLLSSDEFVDTMIDRGCSFGWYFIYIPIGRKPQLDLMPTPEQRDMLRRRVKAIREEKPIFIADFWNDGPLTKGCIAGGRKYLHINAKGDVEPCVFIHFAVDNIKNKSLMEVIYSPFFKSIQDAQKRTNENMLLPCMIIDHPAELRAAIAENGAYATHEGAETLVTEMADHLDKYSVEYAKLANEAWKGYGKQDIWARELWLAKEEETSKAAE